LERYTLSYLPIFDVDLAEALRYIAIRLRNPEAADRLAVDTENAILKRLEAPESFKQYPSKKERLYPYYSIHIRNFTIWYVVVGNVMEVRRFLYSKRNLEELL
jgi:plasmid stabilization system protein ParE